MPVPNLARPSITAAELKEYQVLKALYAEERDIKVTNTRPQFMIKT